jgi:trimeric autotransporter adhesin
MGNAYFNYNGRIVRYDVYDYLTTMNGYLTGPIAIDEQGDFYSKCLRGTGVGKICCLPTIIDKPPVFVKAPLANLTVCKSSVDNGIDSLLSFSDGDIGDNMQLTIISNPAHGTLGGFPRSVVATGGIINPTGFTYTPTAGYQGNDMFKIRISDGTDTGIIQINVFVSPPAVSLIYSHPTPQCIGASTTLNFYPAVGLWSTSNGKATVSATGVATGVDTGTVIITYSNANVCGVTIATVNLTVIDIPVVKIVSAQPELCIGATIQWIATVANGTWSASSPIVSVNGGGLVKGINAGTTMIKYTAGNICGFASDSAAITVLPAGPTPTISGNLTGCPDETSVLTGSVPSGVWSSTNSYIASINATGIVTFIRNGTATIYYAVNDNCITTKGSALVTVKNKTNPGSIYGITSACEGAVSTFTANVPGGTWTSLDPSILAVDNAGNASFLSAGTTTVSYSVSGECGTESTRFVTEVLAVPQLTPITGKSVVIKGKTTELRGRAPYGLWSCDNPAVATIDQWGVVSGLAAGVANVTYSETNANGCLGTVTLAVKVIAAPEIDFVTFPNPASRILSISYTNSTVADAQMWLSDYTGRVVMTGNIDMPASAGIAQFNITGIPDGVYTVTIDSKDGGYVGKVVIIE